MTEKKKYLPPEDYRVQKFYCNTSALVVELTKNGLFIIIAPFKEKVNDNNTYNWDEKDTYNITMDELSNLKAGAEKFVASKFDGTKDVTVFNNFCRSLFEKDNYKSLTLCHDYSKTDKGKNKDPLFKYFGLEAYISRGNPALNFLVKVCVGTGEARKTVKELKFHFPALCLHRFCAYLGYLQQEGFKRNIGLKESNDEV